MYAHAHTNTPTHTTHVPQLADVVVVNLDTDQVIYQQMEALPSLPKTAADTFRKWYIDLSSP